MPIKGKKDYKFSILLILFEIIRLIFIICCVSLILSKLYLINLIIIKLIQFYLLNSKLYRLLFLFTFFSCSNWFGKLCSLEEDLAVIAELEEKIERRKQNNINPEDLALAQDLDKQKQEFNQKLIFFGTFSAVFFMTLFIDFVIVPVAPLSPVIPLPSLPPLPPLPSFPPFIN